MSRTIVFATLGMTQMARGVCGAGMLLSIALSACSDLPKGSPSNGNGNGNGPGTCTLTASNFPTVGELGNVQWVTQAQTPGLLGLTVQIADYATTCGGENAPPLYSAQNYWHGLGFEINAGITPPPFTVDYPGSSDLSFVGCSFGDGVGGDGPVGLACGGSYLCVAGSSVTVSAAGPNTASGSYSLMVSNGVGAPLPVSGQFNITTSCSSLQ